MEKDTSEEVKQEGVAEVGGLVAMQGHGDVWDSVADRVHVWVYGPVAVMFYVDIHSSWYHTYVWP